MNRGCLGAVCRKPSPISEPVLDAGTCGGPLLRDDCLDPYPRGGLSYD
jgi:hypothetical protein